MTNGHGKYQGPKRQTFGSAFFMPFAFFFFPASDAGLFSFIVPHGMRLALFIVPDIIRLSFFFFIFFLAYIAKKQYLCSLK